MARTNLSHNEEKMVFVKRGDDSQLDYAQYTNQGAGAPMSDWKVGDHPNSQGEVSIRYKGDDAPGTRVQLTITVDSDPRCVNVTITA